MKGLAISKVSATADTPRAHTFNPFGFGKENLTSLTFKHTDCLSQNVSVTLALKMQQWTKQESDQYSSLCAGAGAWLERSMEKSVLGVTILRPW